LSNVENLCDALYNAADENQRASAQQQLMRMQSSLDFIPQCQYILDHSSNPYAKLLASNSLTQLITSHWNNFTLPQRIELRNYILNLLALKGSQLEDFVITSLVLLLCRITKLGWFDESVLRDLLDEASKFLSVGVDHYILGLRILNQLVDEVNIPSNGRTLPQHRKTAVSFRDLNLLRIFKISLEALKNISVGYMGTMEVSKEILLGENALKLSLKCLSYDFIGTNPDESSEDVGTIQIPTSWREMVLDPSTLKLFFDFYKSTEPPRSSLAMQNIILLSSIRRSIFPRDSDRATYLQSLMDFLRDILSTQQGLQHQENYHEFCRQLGRLKANYQLNELVRVEGYLDWVESVTNFTLKSFQQWQWSLNSIHYLLALWGRLISAVPYVRSDIGAKNHTQRLQECVQLVMQCYVQSMIDCVETVLMSEGTIDDPLDDEGSLKEQMDRLPTIGRFDYASLATFILNIFDPIMRQYEEAVQHAGTQQYTPTMIQRFNLLEGKLTWLVYICSSLVSGYSWSETSSNDGEEAIDASLCSRMFQLAQGIDFRLSSTGGQGKCSPRLELAIAYFFQIFRRMYMWENHSMGVTTLTTILMTGALPKRTEYGGGSYGKQKIFQSFFENMGLGNSAAVTNIIVTKIGNNLKYWTHNNDIISNSLQLFTDMAVCYSSSKVLLNLDTIGFLIQNHSEEHFPFLAVPSNMRNRTAFQSTLARLIFSCSDDMEALFETFMAPFYGVLSQLAVANPFRMENVRRAVIGVARDLRGVVASTTNKRTYAMVFEALYPTHFPVFVRAIEEWSDSPEVSTSILKFLNEFAYNRAQRLVFEQSSPNGILLFKETSKIVCSYGNVLVNSQAFRSATANTLSAGDPYKIAYKGASLCMNVLTTALSGGYVNFGVFKLYGDKSLDNALEIVLKISLSIPLTDVLSYPKLAKAYYTFFEIIFRNHLSIVLLMDSSVFAQIMTAIHEGLQSIDAPLSAQCAIAIDHLATFMFQKGAKSTPEALSLKAHIQNNPNLLSSLISTLFNILLFDNASSQTANQWACTRPILSLLLADESAFNQYKEHIVAGQSKENAARLTECFDKLLADIQRNLDNSNRDRFTQRLTVFRVSARQFLTF